MKVGDLVRFVGHLGLGVIVEISDLGIGKKRTGGTHSHRVLFSGTGYAKLDGYHWCNPSTLEKICK